MRVVVVGAQGAKGFESWRPGVVEALKQLGHEVHAIPSWNPKAGTLFGLRADLLLWLRHQKTRPGEDVAIALKTFEARGTVTAGLHMDLYQHARRHLIGKDAWWHLQHVFTTEQGDWTGINHHWIPPACTPPANPGQYLQKYAYKAVFTGTVHTKVHGQHRTDLIWWAKQTYGAGFAHFQAKRNPIWGQNLNDLYYSAGVVLTDSGISHGMHWADRVPKTMIRGGILAHPRVEGMERWGITDETAILYPPGDFDYIKARRDSMSDVEAMQMRANAAICAFERHTWTVRLQQMLQTMGLA